MLSGVGGEQVMLNYDFTRIMRERYNRDGNNEFFLFIGCSKEIL